MLHNTILVTNSLKHIHVQQTANTQNSISSSSNSSKLILDDGSIQAVKLKIPDTKKVREMNVPAKKNK